MPTFYKGAGMARDRPSPYGALELLLFIVVRGPVPRDLSIKAHLCSSGSPDPERVRIVWQICQNFRRS